jgi:hypothetical protein
VPLGLTGTVSGASLLGWPCNVALDDVTEIRLGDRVLLRRDVSDSVIGKIETPLDKEVAFEARDIGIEDIPLAEGNGAEAGREMPTVRRLLVSLPSGRLGFE